MIITIIGARPQFVKAAVMSKALKSEGIQEKIIHTGQHYDYKMSEVFFKELGLPGIAYNLQVGSGTHAKQTAQMLTSIEEILINSNDKINYVLVYGDTNSTLAGVLAASKLNIPVAHIEAGLRSYNRTMPEEVNRVVTDHLSELLFCPSDVSANNLAKEGITDNVFIVGDIMLDAMETYIPIAESQTSITEFLASIGLTNYPYNIMTIHRPSNADNSIKLQSILKGIQLSGTSTIWPVHPRVKKQMSKLVVPSNVKMIEPVSYLTMLLLLENANKVITDSGGLQKEAYWMKKPCVTVRPQTEWVETCHNNWNILSSTSADDIHNALQKEVNQLSWTSLYGKGNTAAQIVTHLQA